MRSTAGQPFARIVLGSIVVLGTVFSCACFWLVRGMGAEHLKREIEASADAGAAALQLRFDAHLANIRGTASLMTAMGDVSRGEFAAFVRPELTAHAGIQAVEWAPVITHAERLPLEAQVRAEGYPDFRLTERDHDGTVVEAQVREHYVPVVYVEPMAGNESAFGYADMGKSRRDVISRARDSGRVATSDPLWLVQADRGRVGILVFVPVYDGTPTSVEERRGTIRGYVEGVFLVDDLVGAKGLTESSRVHFALFGQEDNQLLHSTHGGDGAAAEGIAEISSSLLGALEDGPHAERTLRLGDRLLTLVVTPDEGFSTWLPWWVSGALLVAGLLLTGLLFAFIRQMTTQGRRVAALVEQRTAELEEIQRDLFESRKLESVGRMAGAIAHDFNNLLTAIISGAELAALDVDLDSPVAQELESVQKAALKAAEMTQQLLAFSRRQVLREATVDVNQGLRGMHGVLKRLVGHRVQVDLHLTSEPTWVTVDHTQLSRVVTNLAANARDAIDGEGRLTLETDIASVEGVGDCVRIVATDTGAGMEDETLGNVFEPFFTTKQGGRGTGLGLATVFGIVKQSGGSIEAFSQPGSGSRFVVTLPRVEPPPDEALAGAPVTTEKPPAASELRQVPRCVLLVEDMRDVRDAVSAYLERIGHRVHIAEDGARAATLLRKHLDEIDGALLDVVMPGRNGVDTARELLTIASSLPLLFMSGNIDACSDGEREFVMHHGLLDKPFTIRELEKALGGLFAGTAPRSR